MRRSATLTGWRAAASLATARPVSLSPCWAIFLEIREKVKKEVAGGEGLGEEARSL